MGSTDVPNTASSRVMEKADMTLERRATVNRLDTVRYVLAREDR